MSGKTALLDSNIIIYISKRELDFTSTVVNYDDVKISIITYMEVLGFKFKNESEKQKVNELLDCFEIIWLNRNIVEEVISIRQTMKVSLPDAIIAASAKENNYDLITKNTDDFKNIGGLRVINPY